jgi:HTH-type transcriptional regulator/antitoxin HigA
METSNRTKAGTPYIAICPGATLKEELKARGIKQKDFAEQIGMQATHLSELINGKITLTKEIAFKLEEALGISAVFWLGLQNQYDYDKMKIEERNKKNINIDIFKNTPILQPQL